MENNSENGMIKLYHIGSAQDNLIIRFLKDKKIDFLEITDYNIFIEKRIEQSPTIEVNDELYIGFGECWKYLNMRG